MKTPGRHANAERSLARAADIIVTLTGEDANSFAPLSPLSAKLVLPPGYNGPRAPDRRIVQATPRRVVIVGAYRWTPKQMNLSAFLEAADPILQNAGVGIDIVGEVPDSFRQAWEAKVRDAVPWLRRQSWRVPRRAAHGAGRRADRRRV